MTARAITLDSGVLIGFERGKGHIRALLEEAWDADLAVFVPTVVVAEAWRGGARSARVARLLAASTIQPLLERVARKAGEACAHMRSATTIDAIVVASAHASGTTVVTSDPDDLVALAAHFGDVGLIAV